MSTHVGDPDPVLILLGIFCALWLVCTVVVLLVENTVRKAMGRRVHHQRERARVQEQVDTSVAYLEAAYWQASQRLREEARTHRNG